MPDDQGFYLAEPSGPARAGVVVVHDWYGQLPHVRAVAGELALAGQMDRAAAPRRLDEAVTRLKDRVAGGPVGVLGWSLGGSWVIGLAARDDVAAAALYYAAGDEDDAAKIHCPVLLQLAETDEFDPPEFYEGFVAALRAGGTEVEVHTWPGTEHSFANRDVALYTPEQAAEAWSTTVGFLRRHLLGAG